MVVLVMPRLCKSSISFQSSRGIKFPLISSFSDISLSISAYVSVEQGVWDPFRHNTEKGLLAAKIHYALYTTFSGHSKT